MNDEPLFIPQELTQRNRFPILLQLGILSVLMLALFGKVAVEYFTPPAAPTTTPTPIQPISTTNEYPVVAQKITDVTLRAEAAYVWYVRSQRALYAKNAAEPLPLASITKLMTALLAYELIADETMATIPLSAVMQEGYSGLEAGEQLGIEELRELALISSSNDAAFALGAAVGTLLGEADPEAQFVQGMNIRADELGFETLKFWNTTGLDLTSSQPGAVGSARDVSFLMEYIVNNYPEIITPTQEAATRIYNTAGAYHEVNNTNEVALEIPNMIGSKTGFTDLAGGNLTIAFDAGLNRPIIITVLGSTRDERFTDVLTLVSAVQGSLGQQ